MCWHKYEIRVARPLAGRPAAFELWLCEGESFARMEDATEYYDEAVSWDQDLRSRSEDVTWVYLGADPVVH